MAVNLVAVKRHKYIVWHMPGKAYEAKEADAKILIARGLSRVAIPVVEPVAEKPPASADVPRGTRKPRTYKRRDMKAEE